MSGPLTHSTAKILRPLLVGLGHGSDPGNGVDVPGEWPVYVTNEPGSPDSVITIYNTEARDLGRSMPTGVREEQHGFQLRFRAGGDGPADAGFLKARAVAVSLDREVYRQLVAVGSSVYLIHCINRTTDVIDLNRGESPTTRNRRVYTVNGVAVIRELDLLDSLLAMYRLYDDGNDSSGNGQHLDNVSGVTFNGSEAVVSGGGSLYRETALATSGDFSLSAFVRSSNVTVTRPVFGQGLALGVTASSPALEFGGTPRVQWETPAGSNGFVTSVANDTYYHLVITHNASTNKVRFYRGGEIVGQISGAGLDMGGAAIVGVNTALGVFLSSMNLKLVSAYGRVLSHDEVTALYNDGDGFDPTADLSGSQAELLGGGGAVLTEGG